MPSPARLRFSRSLSLLLSLAFLASTGCSGAKPREKWWQFWRPRAHATVSPDEIIPPPTDLPGTPGYDDPLGPPGSSDLDDGSNPMVEIVDYPEIDVIREPAEPAPELLTVYFDYDSDQLDESARLTLDRNVGWIQNHPGVDVLIEGHCDERGTLEYNLNLGQRRANAVKAYLIQHGAPATILHTISYGEERPIAPGPDEESYRQNRRAQFLVY